MDVWQRRRGYLTTLEGVVFVILLCINFKQVLLFNLETRLPIVKHGSKGAYFGFSIAEHQIVAEATGRIDSWLLVGAPLDQNLQPGTRRSGALWKCPMTTNRNDCVQVVTDGKRTIDSRELMRPGADEIKDGQWMGVTVRSQRPGGKVLVCAHRYIYTGADFQWGRGLCYTLTQYLDFDKSFDPCKGRSTKRAHEEFGYCQAGTSGVLTENDTVVIGSPGPYTWRGTIFVYSVSDDFFNRDKTYYAPVMESDSPVEKYSYLGMSVASGTFYGNTTGYAAGAPRANGTGTVILLLAVKESAPIMQVKAELKGEQFASSFGYELASADVNGDKRSDLLVGAPFYYGKESGGAVYVYVNTPEYCLHCDKPVKLTGKPESRFGFAITSLGDLNKDGYDDIAIGAPYEGKGTVYIYLGSDKGLITEPSQVIKAEQLDARSPPATFGYSLSGGIDMDENGYPDLMIGAYEADTAILLRARPIIGIVTKVRPEQHLKNIDPLKHGCSKDPNSEWTCFAFDTCFNIETVGKAFTGDQVLKLTYKLEAETFSGRKFSRVWFGPDSDARLPYVTANVTWTPDDERCSPQIVYLKENTQDIQTPIKFRLAYTLIQEQPRRIIEGESLPSVDRYPILNQQEAVKIFQATFQKDCGDNDICESNLEVKAGLQLPRLSHRDQYELMLGENTEAVLNVTVHNHGESAYESQMYVTHPESLSYIGTSTEEKHITCRPFNKSLVVCNIGNPFKKGSKDLRIRFDPQGLKDREVQLQFSVFANSTSEELNPQEPVMLMANVVKKAELSIHGLARPEQVWYGGMVKGESAIKYRDEVGSRVLHTYQVYNGGPWKVTRLEVHIDWPYQIANTKPQGKWLLYMDEKPTIEAAGGGECYMEEGQVNPLKLIVRPGLDEKPLESMIKSDELKEMRSGRKKRDTEMILRPEAITDKDGRRRNVISSNCAQGTAKCFKFVCVITNLKENTEATIQITARLWNSTLVEDYPRVDWVKIGSRARIHLQGIHQNTSDDEAQVESVAYPDLLDQQEPEPVPIWIIIVAIAAGLLLLILLTFCLWKLGFFKRRRPDPTLSGNIEKHLRDEDYN